MLTVSPTGEVFHVKRGKDLYQGVRLLFRLGPLVLQGIQRGDGYLQLPPAVYLARMAFWTAQNGTRARAIRFVETITDPEAITEKQAASLAAGRIYIHPANWPWELAGCYAPGIIKDAKGVLSSRDAIRCLFSALGGFEAGREFRVRIGGRTK